ncbi:hypothetical protein DM860_009621 [Cuscuta australis]|uniref:PDZ domain-containing protein n=1 Tax=Cuscuta australis TaxID=267555 RepID=A0A328DJH1_9ASTE|nr:hypothetical protein DM860_009621 [Cuscuta australis]
MHNKKAIRALTSSYSHFDKVVEDYYHLDPIIKRAMMRASSSVVSIKTRAGKELLHIGSGTIIEYDEHYGCASVLTSASLLQAPGVAGFLPSDLKVEIYLFNGELYEGQVLFFDFCYNVATIKIMSSKFLSTASIRDVTDSLELVSKKPVLSRCQHLPNTSMPFNLSPGKLVIALGRDCGDRYDIMASPGVFSAQDCCHDYEELFMTSCVVSKLAVGGPLVNCDGEVIGVNFFICPFATFVPITIVWKCLENLKRNGQVPRPWLGVRVGNLYTANLDTLDELYQKFPNVSKGVIVEELTGKINIHAQRKRTKVHHSIFWLTGKWLTAKAMLQKRKRSKTMTTTGKTTSRAKKRRQLVRKSSASVAGLCIGDVIIKCGETEIRSQLELVDALWDKEGKSVKLEIVRPSVGHKNVTLTVGARPEMPRWLL